MRTIALFAQKGGSGKSTIAIHLAVLAARGQRVLLVDADPQGTVAAWGQVRTHVTPMVVRAEPSSIAEVIQCAREEGFELVLVDCPPHSMAGTTTLLRHVDHILIPVQPSMPDIVATQRSVALAGAAAKPYSFVINRAPPRAVEVEQAREVLAAAGPVAPVTFGDRRAFARALTNGLAVSEYSKDNEKAVLEVLNFYLWLDGHLLELDQCRKAA